MHIIGDRLCGEITCQRSVDLDLIGVCDCIACQPVSGSALQFTGRVARKDFSLTTRKLSAYAKVAESGIPRAMSVCGRCTTRMAIRRRGAKMAEQPIGIGSGGRKRRAAAAAAGGIASRGL